MGNQCCRDDTVQSTQIIQSSLTPNSNKINESHNQISYIDSQGNPLPNAYKRFVKPPTTVGRQSLIVRDLHENDDVPDWIWAFDKNILSSNHNKRPSKNAQILQNRKTFQQIQGHFKGVQTVNLSKLNFQPKNMATSANVANFNNIMGQNQNQMRYTVQPVPLHQTISQSNKPIFYNQMNNAPVINQNIPLKRTFSSTQVPIINSVNASQNIVQNNAPINSNMVSVNNSIQHSPMRPINVIRY